MKKYLLLLSLVLISCHYKKDKLKIVNNSETKISYEVLIKSKDDDTFYFVSAGGEIKSKDFDYPTVRNTILYTLEANSSDRTLYLVFFDNKDLDFVYKNEETIMLNKNFKTAKYTIEDLNKLNWTVVFQSQLKEQ